MKAAIHETNAILAAVLILSGSMAAADEKVAGLNGGKPSGGVIVYQKMHFDEGLEGWESSGGGQVSLTSDAISGKALRVACEKSWAAAQLPLAINGSKDLKMALLMKGRNLPLVGVNIHDAASGDNTTPYAYRYLRDGGWTPILYRLDRCRYNSTTEGYVRPATRYDELRFYGPSDAKPGMEFTIDDLVIYRGTDRQPPGKVTGLAAQATPGGVKLSWQPAADNVGVQVYVVTRADGGSAFQKIAESYAVGYLDTAAGEGTYRYRVFAVDFEENYGPWSDPLAVHSTGVPRKTAPTREEQDRLGYADRTGAVHARGAGKVRKGQATLFGDSLTAATVYPQCAEAAFGTLSVDAFGYPSMRTDFGRGKVKEILDKENPGIHVHSLWHEQQQGAEGPATGHGRPCGDRPRMRRARHRGGVGHHSAPRLGARLAARGRLQRRAGQALPEAEDPGGLHLRGFSGRRARRPPQVPRRRRRPLARRGHGDRRPGLGQDARPDPLRFAGPEVTKLQTWFLVLLPSIAMSKLVSWSILAALVSLGGLGAASAGTGLKAVPEAPGAFELQGGPAPEIVRGKPLAAAQVESLAGKPDGYDILADGASLFGMECAHCMGRREPLRPLAADLSDWGKAPQCPPDRVLVDPRTGRVRFFPGDDPARFESKVVANFRGTHGDCAFARWRGNTLFLSHWESSFHVWAYDAGNPAAPAKVGELAVENFAHGFVLLDSGWALMGTTGRGLVLLDLHDPAKMKLVKSLLPEYDWVDVIAPGFVGVWQAKKGARDDPRGPRVFDVSKLPDEMTEVTENVKPDVRRYLADRFDHNSPASPDWFRLADQNIALIDLGGGPAAWKIVRTVPLPQLSPAERKGDWMNIRVEMLVPGKRFVLLYPGPDGKNRLQILDVSGGKAALSAPVEAAEEASQLSLFEGKYAYVSVLPEEPRVGANRHL